MIERTSSAGVAGLVWGASWSPRLRGVSGVMFMPSPLRSSSDEPLGLAALGLCRLLGVSLGLTGVLLGCAPGLDLRIGHDLAERLGDGALHGLRRSRIRWFGHKEPFPPHGGLIRRLQGRWLPAES